MLTSRAAWSADLPAFQQRNDPLHIRRPEVHRAFRDLLRG
jgi:hypothetical protein